MFHKPDKRLTITATATVKCWVVASNVWFCLHSKYSHTIVNWHRIHQLSQCIYPAYTYICYCCCSSAFSFVCLSHTHTHIHTHTVFCSCSMMSVNVSVVITFVSCLACFHYFMANFNTSVVSPIASDSPLCIQLTPGNELLLIRPQAGRSQAGQEAKQVGQIKGERFVQTRSSQTWPAA